LIIEAHPDPDRAMCDGSQTITPAELAGIVESGRVLYAALLAGPETAVAQQDPAPLVHQA
jgi:3-deoxy-D-manno-octulosonic acid (KDO) 8-phosphate synthase